jgi:hypothetical protein
LQPPFESIENQEDRHQLSGLPAGLLQYPVEAIGTIFWGWENIYH